MPLIVIRYLKYLWRALIKSVTGGRDLLDMVIQGWSKVVVVAAFMPQGNYNLETI